MPKVARLGAVDIVTAAYAKNAVSSASSGVARAGFAGCDNLLGILAAIARTAYEATVIAEGTRDARGLSGSGFVVAHGTHSVVISVCNK